MDTSIMTGEGKEYAFFKSKYSEIWPLEEFYKKI